MSKNYNWRITDGRANPPYGRTATMSSWLLAGKSLEEVAEHFEVGKEAARLLRNRITIGRWLPTLGEYISDYNEILERTSNVKRECDRRYWDWHKRFGS